MYRALSSKEEKKHTANDRMFTEKLGEKKGKRKGGERRIVYGSGSEHERKSIFKPEKKERKKGAS